MAVFRQRFSVLTKDESIASKAQLFFFLMIFSGSANGSALACREGYSAVPAFD